MEERPTFPDVQGNERVVWSGAEEAYTYMVLVLGRKERIPQRFEIKEGGSEIFMCLQVRYGLRPKEDFARLLIWQLLMSKNDNHIWGAWREAYAKREVSKTKLTHRITLLTGSFPSKILARELN